MCSQKTATTPSRAERCKAPPEKVFELFCSSQAGRGTKEKWYKGIPAFSIPHAPSGRHTLVVFTHTPQDRQALVDFVSQAGPDGWEDDERFYEELRQLREERAAGEIHVLVPSVSSERGKPASKIFDQNGAYHVVATLFLVPKGERGGDRLAKSEVGDAQAREIISALTALCLEARGAPNIMTV